ncbi:MAG: hypothetical protein IIA66_13075, partial [Planctomycetes bacterium]|nr:hypothetical protein [Planctomycetota bacterium]
MSRHIALLGVLFGLGLQTSLWGEIINVPGDQPSIQAAINAADDGDEIIVAPGTYFENINFLSKAITLGSSEGREVTTIDAANNGTVVTCDSGEGPDTVLDGFAIKHRVALFGGGMLNVNSSPTVSNCTFVGNSAARGGGMYNLDSSPTVTNCTFSGNNAPLGGGMFNRFGSSPTVTNCTFSGNTATLGWGGGMLNTNSSLTVSNCTFS